MRSGENCNGFARSEGMPPAAGASPRNAPEEPVSMVMLGTNLGGCSCEGDVENGLVCFEDPVDSAQMADIFYLYAKIVTD